LELWILLGCTIALQFAVLRRLEFDGITTAIVLTGTVLCFDYLTYTSISERNFDGSSHVEYVQFVKQHWRVPDERACGVCGHPPLYYALAALWSKVMLIGLPLELGLQWLSLLLFFGFVVFALLIFRDTASTRLTSWLATALVVFWPSSIINSVRVHNDALASLLMAATIYFTARWDQYGRARDFSLALTASALALLTKSSGYAVAAILVATLLLRLFSRQEPASRVARRGSVAVLVLALAGFLAVGLRDAQGPRTLCQTVLGSACRGRYVPPLPDTLDRFISFDPFDFVRRIETAPLDPFLHRFLKSMLFGVQPPGDEFSGPPYAIWAAIMSLLLLVMLTVCLIAALSLPSASLRKYRVYLASPVILFIFLIAFRLRVPNEFHEDFRHIFPALVPFCLGYVKAVERLGRRSKVLYSAGVAVGLLMVSSSIAFFVRLP
jgi:hypothetical protein